MCGNATFPDLIRGIRQGTASVRHILRHRRNAPSSDIDRARNRASERERMSEECERECLFMSEWSGWRSERGSCLSFLLRSLTGKRTNEAVKEELSTNVRSRRDQLSRRSSRHTRKMVCTNPRLFFSLRRRKQRPGMISRPHFPFRRATWGNADEVGNVDPIRIWV